MTVSRRDFCHRLSAVVPAALLAQRIPMLPAETIRLDSNENPYGPFPSARGAIARAIADGNRYPGGDVQALVDEIAKQNGVGPSNVLLTVGATEGLIMCARAFTRPDAALVTAAPSYETIAATAERLRSPVIRVPLRDDGRLDLDTMSARAATAGLVYACNPNNPTGVSIPATAMRSFIASAPHTTFVIGEAYHEYVETPGYESMATDAMRNSRIVVSRTFSKLYGLAGLRLGYLIAADTTIRELARLRVGLGANSLAVMAAAVSLHDVEEQDRQRRLTRESREATMRFFSERGWRVLPGEANYLFVDIKRDLPTFRAACESRGLLVGRIYPPATTWMRITIGTRDEMQRAFAILGDVL
ncbi:MAG: aminotransferase class I/II-fold pyridoxal phosphate-dependent enzyme [Gemmatimonadaceae bacterium]